MLNGLPCVYSINKAARQTMSAWSWPLNKPSHVSDRSEAWIVGGTDLAMRRLEVWPASQPEREPLP